MPSYSRNEVVLVRYPFSDLTAAKIRPAVIVGTFARSPDHLIVPLTSRTSQLAPGEFTLVDWRSAGLNVPSAVKRGVYTVHASLILKSVGKFRRQTRAKSSSRYASGSSYTLRGDE